MSTVGESAVAFMKEQHQTTLFELRAEIALLRQKNADLTMSAALSETMSEGRYIHLHSSVAFIPSAVVPRTPPRPSLPSPTTDATQLRERASIMPLGSGVRYPNSSPAA